MLSNLTKVCPRCNKSRETYYAIEKDPKKRGKSWQIERCPKCAYNFDILEVAILEKRDEPKPKKDNEDDGGMFGRARGGWLV